MGPIDPEPAQGEIASASDDKQPDLDARRKAVEDAASTSGGLWVSYLFVLFYLLISAGAVTHRDLFFEHPVKMPFLNIELPLKGFFWLGPAIFLVVHAYILLHFVVLSGKIDAYNEELEQLLSGDEGKKARLGLRRLLPTNIFVQFLAGPEDVRGGATGGLLRTIAWISLVVGPVALLVFIQLQFLPYHDAAITWWQRVAVLLDIALLWVLWPKIDRGQPISNSVRRTTDRWLRPVAALLADLSQRVLVLLDIVRVRVLLPIIKRGQPISNSTRRTFERWSRLVAASLANLWHRISVLLDNVLLRVLPSVLKPGQPISDSTRRTTGRWLRLMAAFLTSLPQWVAAFVASLWHRVTLLPEIMPLWVPGRRVNIGRLSSNDTRHTTGRWLRFAPALLASLVPIALVLGIATFPGEWLDGVLPRPRVIPRINPAGYLVWRSAYHVLLVGSPNSVTSKPSSPWSNRLVLMGLDGIDRGKFDTDDKIKKARETISLRGRDLRGAVLDRTDLRKADLTRAQLEGASLNSAQLEGVILDYARLQDATLVDASLQRASLRGAQLQRALLRGAHLENAKFGFAKLQGASLSGAHLQGATLKKEQLEGVSLSGAHLQGLALDGAQFQGASLEGADLQGASLEGAHLEGASLDDADLQGASLGSAHLEGASFFGAFVWRACTGNHVKPCSGSVKTDGMLVTKEIITGAQWPCPGDEEALCEWSEESFESLQQEIKSGVPVGKRREKALIRIEALNPEPRETDHIAEFWDHLKNDSELKAEEPVYIARAEAWQDAGCDARGAPYVVTSLAKWLEIGNPFPKGSPHITELAAAFLHNQCAGARGISEETRTTLKALAGQAPPPQTAPSAAIK